MSPLAIHVASDGESFYPVLEPEGAPGPGLAIPVPVECRYLDGDSDRLLYAGVDEESEGMFLARCSWSRPGYAFSLTDRWHSIAPDRVRLDRRVSVSGQADQRVTPGATGLQMHLALRITSPGE